MTDQSNRIGKDTNMATEAEAKIDSTFAILDVKKGRKKLAKHFASRPPFGECPKEMRIPVTITGYIDCQNSRDDGESIEFGIVVERAQINLGEA